VRLEPLTESHASGLLDVGREEAVWTWLSRGPFADLEDVRGWIAQAQQQTDTLAFAVVAQSSGRAIGSTRFMDVRPADRGLEIGWTWYALAHQGSAVNPESKWLLLRYAFECWGAERVALKCDLRNLRSQRAIEKLGAVREGVLRRHLRVRDGFLRDSVYYSILRSEWPAVESGLLRRLERWGAGQM
jgi:RimJ/RimL family protein N-acetyltransferase